ncbi:MAG: bifunctional DNA primase/polymerase [Phototrophicaceae bacterium]
MSDLQRQAYDLYDLGLNVLPQPIGQKGGLPWKRLQYSRLNRDNPNYGLRNLFAGDSNLAIMCGSTSQNLFVIDCESNDSFHYHLQQLHNRKIPIWAVQTARGGHIYLRATNGEVHSIETGILVDAEIKGRNGYVLAPPSIHPSGAVYHWIVQQGDNIPAIDTKDIDWLRDKNGQMLKLEFDAPATGKTGNWSMAIVSPASNLSVATRDYLQNGNHLPQGARNNRLFKAACDMAGNQYSQSETETILIPIAAMSGLPQPEITATIRSAYSRQRSPSRSTQQSLLYTWRYALLWAIKHQWDSKTVGSDRALFLALIERARVSSNENDVFRASIRELSELGSLGTTTIQRALARLQADNLITSCGYDRNSKASLWRFNDELISVAKQIELNLNTVSIPPHWLRYSESLFNSDIVERGALGHSVLFVYEFMRTLHKPMMPSDIAESMDLSLNQINYALRKLKEHTLVQRLDAGWYLSKMTVPELEALFEHVAGKGDERARKYREEREVFAGVILFNARIRREGKMYMNAVSQQLAYQRQSQQLRDDPLIMLGIELGGVLRMEGEHLH